MINEAIQAKDKDKAEIVQVVAQAGKLVRDRLLRAPTVVSDVTTHLAAAGGKGIRTVLLVNCAADDEGLAPWAAAKAAAALELLHLATLVHDDIIDDAPLRRGAPSVHSKFGKKKAVISGDYLLCAAMNLSVAIDSSETDAPDKTMLPRYARALESVCLGELEQNFHSCDITLSPMGYFRIIMKKTATLFFLAAAGGSALGKRDRRQTRLLTRFAVYLGMIFQIVDDLKDYVCEEADISKPVRHDIASGVVTLPLIMGCRRDPALAGLAREAMRTGREVESVIRAVQAAGGTDAAREIAQRYGEKALAVLQKVEQPRKRDALRLLLDKALGAADSF